MTRKGKVSLPEDSLRKLRAYKAVFTSPNGEEVLNDLRRQFGGTTLRKVDGRVDEFSSIAAAGCREVVLYIEQLVNIKMDEDAVD